MRILEEIKANNSNIKVDVSNDNDQSKDEEKDEADEARASSMAFTKVLTQIQTDNQQNQPFEYTPTGTEQMKEPVESDIMSLQTALAKR